MPQTRQLVISGLLGALTHGTTGLNAKIAAISGSYDLAPNLAFGWAPESRQLFIGFLEPDQLENSQISEFPAVVMYTTSSENQLLEMPTKFSGPITARVDIYLRRDILRNAGGPELDNTEKWANAVEDALIEALYAYAWPAGVMFLRAFKCDRDPIVLLGDGWAQRIPFEIPFEVCA